MGFLKNIPLELPQDCPESIAKVIGNAPLFDSSCSHEAKVWYIDKDGGLFLKRSHKGWLANEANLGQYFHSKNLAPEIVDYISGDVDWMLSRKAVGKDCTAEEYLANPEKLCDTYGETLRMLHELSFDGCPVPNRTETYLATVENNYKTGQFGPMEYADAKAMAPDEAWAVVEANRQYFKQDVLLHGDYCLPNVLLQNGKFSSFIDLGNGGVGDRHIDLFWGIWTLWFNLHTDKYAGRFLDAYGRDKMEKDMLQVIYAAEHFG
ncbi:MAG: aminoglycoside 3'-phosphotransferase [Clostridia bacterium]|nr:aminoglycoside 3'-phosphotransferase [Clostridia bacterium]